MEQRSCLNWVRHAGIVGGLFMLSVVLSLVASATAARAQHTFVQVLDASGTALDDLTAEDFAIRQNDVECRIVSVTLVNEPLRIALLVDDSDGAGAYFRFLRDGLPVMVDALPADSEIGLFLLSGRARLVVAFDDGLPRVREQLENYFVDASRGSGFADGMSDALARFPDDTRWPVMIAVTTDGPAARQNTFTQGKYQELLDGLRERAATVHALGLFTTRGSGFQTGIARDTAQLTGGWFDTVASPGQIVHTKLLALAEEVAARHESAGNQYLIEYETPDNDDSNAPISAGVRRQGVTLVLSPDGRARAVSPGRPTATSVSLSANSPGGQSREEYWNAAEAAFAAGHTDRAAQLYELAYQADQTWGKPLHRLGLVALNQGNTDSALRYFERVVEIDPDSEEGVQARAFIEQLSP